ncbi:amidohydrolase family protein [Miniimonas arenae]|uniref:amidohydrolase family protein n=1 Tax=Miniimonas arenae TaxID=676201 RepID=UPI0028AD521B|nr:amidohydrolase family protein [Miniimonas arenae]
MPPRRGGRASRPGARRGGVHGGARPLERSRREPDRRRGPSRLAAGAARRVRAAARPRTRGRRRRGRGRPPLADAGADLCALLALGQVVGVRHLLQHEPDGALADPLLARGLAVVAEAGLVFDACVRHEQLDALVRLLAASPATRVMLDHLGKPPVRAGLGSPSGAAWAHAIDRLAARPETWVKLSGLAPECASRDELDRYGGDLLRHALAAFGPDRAVLASDWPVSATLGAAVNPAEWWTWVATEADLGPAGWRAVAEGTARRAYRLSHA